MADTIVNTGGTPTPVPALQREDNGAGLVLGLLLFLVVLFAFIYYGVPAIRNLAVPDVSVPRQVDVNINAPNR